MKAALIFCCLILALPLRAQTGLPDAPKPKHENRVWIVGSSVLVASQTADFLETRSLLARGGYERNPIFGAHPSAGKQAGIGALFSAGEIAFFYWTEHQRRRWLRWTGRAAIGFWIEEHSLGAACNASIPDVRNLKHVENCHSLLW